MSGLGFRHGTAKGTIEGGDTFPKIAIRFRPEVFNKLNVRAINHNVSFAEEVRRLVDFALARMKEGQG